MPHMKMDRVSDQVSVVIPTYNREKIIAEAVESALAQTYAKVEILVVDDGSIDDTENRLAAYGDRIRYIKQTNGGASSARNRGILESTGEWVAFLDSDDLWHPEKLATQMAQLQAHPGVRMHSVNLAVERSLVTSTDFFSEIGLTVDANPQLLENAFSTYVQKRFAWLQTTVVHASLLAETGLFNTRYPIYEDYDLLARCAMNSQWLLSPVPMVEILRRTSGNLSDLRTEQKLPSLLNMLEINRALLARCEQAENISPLAIRQHYLKSLSAAANQAFRERNHGELSKLRSELKRSGNPKLYAKQLVYGLVSLARPNAGTSRA